MHINRSFLALALTLPFFASSCGERSVNASDLVASATEKVKALDLSGMSTEDMTSKVTGLAGDLVAKLGKVKDEAGAKVAAAEIEPVADQLGLLKKALGDKMPNLGSLRTAVESITTKFGSNDGIMKALKPILEKLTGLTS